MVVIGSMDREFGADDEEVVVDSKEEEHVAMEEEEDISTKLSLHGPNTNHGLVPPSPTIHPSPLAHHPPYSSVIFPPVLLCAKMGIWHIQNIDPIKR